MEIVGLHDNGKRPKDLPKLVKEVTSKVQLEVWGRPGDDHRIRLYASLTQIADAVTELRTSGLARDTACHSR
jgi:hypothetical protein